LILTLFFTTKKATPLKNKQNFVGNRVKLRNDKIMLIMRLDCIGHFQRYFRHLTLLKRRTIKTDGLFFPFI